MPYGSPQNAGDCEYAATVQHVATGVWLRLSTGPGTGPSVPTESNSDTAFQALVDLVAASTDFDFSGGAKSRLVAQVVTAS